MKALRNFIAGSALVTGIRGSSPATKPSELFSGVEKPTITLAYMLCAEMLQNLDNSVAGREEYQYNSKYERKWRFPSFDITIGFYRGANNIEGSHDVTRYNFKADPRLTFDTKEKQILVEGFKKFKAIWDARRKNEAETARQEKAINAIASFFGKPAEDTQTEG